jgi:hypothetical protein
MTARSPCPSCSAPLSTSDVLDGCSVSIPQTRLFRLHCPHCGAQALARLANGSVELGAAAGEGGARFLATSVAAAPDLFVRQEAAWVDCWHGRVYRRFPVG